MGAGWGIGGPVTSRSGGKETLGLQGEDGRAFEGDGRPGGQANEPASRPRPAPHPGRPAAPPRRGIWGPARPASPCAPDTAGREPRVEPERLNLCALVATPAPAPDGLGAGGAEAGAWAGRAERDHPPVRWDPRLKGTGCHCSPQSYIVEPSLDGVRFSPCRLRPVTDVGKSSVNHGVVGEPCSVHGTSARGTCSLLSAVTKEVPVFRS